MRFIFGGQYEKKRIFDFSMVGSGGCGYRFYFGDFMTIGTRVKTEHGTGTIIGKDGPNGILARHFCVQMDDPKHTPNYDFSDMQNQFGGLYFLDTELDVIS